MYRRRTRIAPRSDNRLPGPIKQESDAIVQESPCNRLSLILPLSSNQTSKVPHCRQTRKPCRRPSSSIIDQESAAIVQALAPPSSKNITKIIQVLPCYRLTGPHQVSVSSSQLLFLAYKRTSLLIVSRSVRDYHPSTLSSRPSTSQNQSITHTTKNAAYNQARVS
jgi:hypothetical protein